MSSRTHRVVTRIRKHREKQQDQILAKTTTLGSLEQQPIILYQNHDFLFRTYNDHSKDAPDGKKYVTKGGVLNPFPLKLHKILEDFEQEELLAQIISWQPHGRSFVVHKHKSFVNVILPKYFGLTKFASFQRQLNLYGFSRLTKGVDRGGYYHEFFLRGMPFLCRRIERMRVKGTGVRMASSPETEPDFYSMPYIPSSSSSSSSSFPSFTDDFSRPVEAQSTDITPEQNLTNEEERNEEKISFEGMTFHCIPPPDDTWSFPVKKEEDEQQGANLKTKRQGLETRKEIFDTLFSESNDDLDLTNDETQKLCDDIASSSGDDFFTSLPQAH